MKQYDVAVIGAGATGASIAWQLSHFDLKVALVDRCADASFGVSKANLEKLYCENMMRFIGKNEVKVEIEAPQTDDSHIWLPTEPSVKTVIEKNKFFSAFATRCFIRFGRSKRRHFGHKNLLSYIKFNFIIVIFSVFVNFTAIRPAHAAKILPSIQMWLN